MKIDINAPLTSGISAKQPAKATPAAESRDYASPQDRTTLSVDSVAVSALQARALETPPIRSDRVAALRLSIQRGAYHVDTHKAAEGILRDRGK